MANPNQAQTIELTQQGYDELKQELEELSQEKLPQVIERVANAREQGDLNENADYQNAKDEQTMVETRIAEIGTILSRAKVVKQTSNNQKVGIGSNVVVNLVGKRGTKTFQIVGEFEGEPDEGKISSVSPLGKALVGKKKGDQAEVSAPAGTVVYQIREIR